MSVCGAPPAPLTPQTQSQVFRRYYEELDIFVSAEGVLKVISILGCIVASVLFLSGGSCGGAPALLTSGASVALGVAAVGALLYAGAAAHLPRLAPQAYLYTDIILSSVGGVLLLVAGVLSVTICELDGLLDYMHGPLSVLIAAAIMGNTVITYSSAMRHWDAHAGPAREPRTPLPQELEV